MNLKFETGQISLGLKRAVKLDHLPPAISPPWVAIAEPKTREQIAESLIRMLMDGPEVSFRGSPTVSPTTEAACSLSPFLTNSPSSSLACLRASFPASTNFLQLSQAPPELEAEKAIWIPETMAPARIPLVA